MEETILEKLLAGNEQKKLDQMGRATEKDPVDVAETQQSIEEVDYGKRS